MRYFISISVWKYSSQMPLSNRQSLFSVACEHKQNKHIFLFFFSFPSFFFLLLFRAALAAYGHMAVPRLGVKSKLYLPAYTTAIAMWDPSLIFYLYHSSRQCCILDPLSKARDRTRPCGYQLGSLLLSHNENFKFFSFLTLNLTFMLRPAPNFFLLNNIFWKIFHVNT